MVSFQVALELELLGFEKFQREPKLLRLLEFTLPDVSRQDWAVDLNAGGETARNDRFRQPVCVVSVGDGRPADQERWFLFGHDFDS